MANRHAASAFLLGAATLVVSVVFGCARSDEPSVPTPASDAAPAPTPTPAPAPALASAPGTGPDRQAEPSPPEAAAAPIAPSAINLTFAIRSVTIETDPGPDVPITAGELYELVIPLVQRETVLVLPSPSEADVATNVRLRDLPGHGRDGELRFSVGAIQSSSQVIMDAYADLGMIGIRVTPDEDLLDEGVLAIFVDLGRVFEISVVNHGNRADPAEIDWLLAAVPLRVGDLIYRPALDGFLEGAAERLGTRVDAAIEPSREDCGVRIILVVGESGYGFP